MIRLTVDDPRFSFLWPQLCARAKRLWVNTAPYIPADSVLAEWLHKVTQLPNLLPIWLILEDDRKIVGHLVAEAMVYHTQFFIFVHQIQSDQPSVTKQFKNKTMESFLGWIYDMNRLLAEADSPGQFRAIRFLSPHAIKFWKRWFPLECILEEHTLTFAIPEPKPEDVSES